MKIESVTATEFSYPTRRSVDAAGHSHPGPETLARQAVLTIRTTDGAEGHVFAPSQVVRTHVLNQFVRKVLVGADPFQRERLWSELEHWQRGSAGQLTDRALAAVDSALWDLQGRVLNQPVYKLLGGYRDRIPAYGSTMCGDELAGGLSTPEEYAAFAVQLVEKGYKAIKLHTWMPPVAFAPDPGMDIRACTAVRQAVGPDIALMLDGYHEYSRTDALRIGRALEELDFEARDWQIADVDHPVPEIALVTRVELASEIQHDLNRWLSRHRFALKVMDSHRDVELTRTDGRSGRTPWRRPGCWHGSAGKTSKPAASDQRALTPAASPAAAPADTQAPAAARAPPRPDGSRRSQPA